MSSFKMDKNSLAKFEKQMQKNLDKTAERANKAATKASTPETQAWAFAREMKRDGISVNEADLRKHFRR